MLISKKGIWILTILVVTLLPVNGLISLDLITKATIGDLGGINESFADETYLRLDTSNDPLQGNLNLGNYNITNTTCITLANGQPMCWNTDYSTLDIPSGLGNTWQVGQELTLIRKNGAGVPIYAGQVVYVSGTQGERLLVDLADASDPDKIHDLGIVTIPVCNINADCPVTYFGQVNDLDTTIYSGIHLYLSADGSGNLTDTLPENAFHIHMADIVRNHSSTGIIDVDFERIDIGDEPIFNNFKTLGNVTAGNDICIEGGNCLSSVSGGSNWNQTGDYLYPAQLSNYVGIGTSSPQAEFHINSSTNNTNVLFEGNANFITSGNTGLNFVSNSTQDTSVGSISWTGIGNIYANDGVTASFLDDTLGSPTYYLVADDLGFSVPSGATIVGVEFQVEKLDSFGCVIDSSVKLEKGGAIVGSNKKETSTTYWGSTPRVATYGGATDLWGLTLTPSDVNAANFGLAISAQDGCAIGDAGLIDYVSGKVYYTEVGGDVVKWSAGQDGYGFSIGSSNNSYSNTSLFIDRTKFVGFNQRNPVGNIHVTSDTNETNVIFESSITQEVSTNTGYTFPTLSGQDTGWGSETWVDTDNALASDDTYAYFIDGSAGSPSYYLTTTGFGFDIPSNAVVTGIIFEVQRFEDLGFCILDSEIKIIKGGAIGTVNKANTTVYWSDDGFTETTVTYGSTTDLWGDNWTASDINSANFGLAISGYDDCAVGATGYIDYVKAYIYYTANITTGNKWSTGVLNNSYIVSKGTSVTENQSIVIDSNRNVGIGTTTPGEKLEVNGSINVTAGNDICIEGGNCLSSVSGGSSLWTQNGSNIYYNSGNVGIGTLFPNADLHVEGNLTIGSTQDYTFTHRSGTVLALQSQTSATANNFELYTKDGDGTDTVRLALYNVGTPDAITNRERLMIEAFDTVTGYYRIKSEAGGTGTVRPIKIETGSNTDQLVFATDGNVGIGTSSPNARLHVVGGLRAIGEQGVTTNPGDGIVLTAGAGSSSFPGSNGGDINLTAGSADNAGFTGSGGDINIQAGSKASSGGTHGAININSKGDINIAGNAGFDSNAGNINILGNMGNAGSGGVVNISSGDALSGNGASLYLSAGDGSTGFNGGSVYIDAGTATGTVGSIYAQDNLIMSSSKYLLGRQPMFSAYKNAAGSSFTTTASYIAWNVETVKDSECFAHTANSDNIDIDCTGLFKIEYSIPIDISSGSARSTSHCTVRDSGATIPGSGATCYNRQGGNGDDTCAKQFVVSLTDTDTVDMYCRRYTGTDTLFTQYDATYGISPSITITYLGAS